nr:hypothetical protein CFP56_07519 [Quercus suber]
MLHETRTTHARNLEENKNEHAQILATSDEKHQQAIARLHQEQENTLNSMQATQEQRLSIRLAEAKASLQTTIDEIESRQTQALADLEAAKTSEAQALQNDHHNSIAALQQRLVTELNAARELHEQGIHDMQVALEARINDLRASHDQVIADRDNEWVTEVSKIKDAHSQALSDARSSTDAGTARMLEKLEAEHSESLRKAIESAQLQASSQSSISELRHQQTLEQALREAKREAGSEVDALRSSHEEALQSLLKEAEEQTHAQLIDMEENHGVALNAAVAECNNSWESALQRQAVLHSEEIAHLHETLTNELGVLQAELEKAADSRQHEMNTAELQHQDSYAALNEKLAEAEKQASDMLYKHESMGVEVAALRARLDAELTAHAEAERALAKLQRQRADDDKQGMESKDALQKQLVSLQQEKDNISNQHAQVSSSLRDLRRKSQIGSSPQTPRTSDELAEAQMRIVAVESERDEANDSFQKALSEKTALAHQNEFLVKELEALMTQLAAPKHNTHVNAEMQTDISLPSSPPRIPVQDPLEPKSDVSSMQSVKGSQRGLRRPITPLRRVTASENMKHWRTGSFEEYMEQAKSELSSLGNVITANEALFAQKIAEHIGDLQLAKDQLSDEYKQNLEALQMEKEQMQKDAAMRGAAEFAKERKKLVATYGVALDEPSAQAAMLTSLPLTKAVALRTAEERLVSEFNRRIARRKSQIALKHAEEYQHLTQDYDRKIAELLQDKDRLEGDLSIEPSKFEDDMNELDNSIKLEKELRDSVRNSPKPRSLAESPKGPETPRANMQLPRRVLTSVPRTQTSIPRSSSLPKPATLSKGQPGSGASDQLTPSRGAPGEGRAATDRHLPTPQRSLLRGKTPSEVQLQRGTANPHSPQFSPSIPTSADGLPRPAESGIAAHDFEEDAAATTKSKMSNIAAAVTAAATTNPIRSSGSRRTAEPRGPMEERGRLCSGASDQLTPSRGAPGEGRAATDRHLPTPQRSLLRGKTPSEVQLQRGTANPHSPQFSPSIPTSADGLPRPAESGIAAHDFEEDAAATTKSKMSNIAAAVTAAATTNPIRSSGSRRTAEPRGPMEERGRLIRKVVGVDSPAGLTNNEGKPIATAASTTVTASPSGTRTSEPVQQSPRHGHNPKALRHSSGSIYRHQTYTSS